MNGRRGFLALVGGAFVTGGVKAGQAARPTLLLPTTGLVLPPTSVARSRSPMVDMARVLDGLPSDIYEDWIRGGLNMVEGCKPGGQIYRAALTEGRDLAAEVEQARAKHDRWLEGNGLGDMVRMART